MYGVEIIESNWEADHIHVLFDAMPSTNLVKFINAYKTVLFSTTSGWVNIETIRNYIKRQRKK